MPKLKANSTLKKKKASDAPSGENVPQRLYPSVKKLKEEKWYTRSVGCRDIAALALEENAVQPLLQCGAADLLLPLLFDNSMAVRLNAIRAMQNLLLGSDANIFPATANVLQQMRTCFGNSVSKLKAAIAENRTDTPESKPKKNKKMDIEIDDEEDASDLPETIGNCGALLTELLQLMAGFCYYEDSYVQAFSTDTEVLVAIIECTTLHHIESNRSTVAVAAAEFLLLLCDDNPVAMNTLQHSVPAECQQILQTLFTSPTSTPLHLLAKVIISGIVWQFQGQALRSVVQLLKDTLSSLHPHNECQEALSKSGEAKGLALQHLHDNLLVLKNVLEISTNIICSTEASGEDDDEKMFRRTATGKVILELDFAATVGQKASEILASASNPQVEETLRNPLSAGSDEGEDGEALQKSYDEAETALIVLLLNLIMVVPVKNVGNPTMLWTGFQMVFKRDALLIPRLLDTTATEGLILNRLENLCGCLWTILRKCGSSCKIDGAFISSLVSFTAERKRTKKAIQSEEFYINVLRFVGSSVPYLTEASEVNTHAVSSSCQLCMDFLKESSLPQCIEAANALIDAFSEDNWNEGLSRLRMIHHLQLFANSLPEKLRILSDSIDEDLAPRIEVVTSNLQPFIDYKKGMGM